MFHSLSEFIFYVYFLVKYSFINTVDVFLIKRKVSQRNITRGTYIVIIIIKKTPLSSNYCQMIAWVNVWGSCRYFTRWIEFA